MIITIINLRSLLASKAHTGRRCVTVIIDAKFFVSAPAQVISLYGTS
jgi:hypothetical protein